MKAFKINVFHSSNKLQREMEHYCWGKKTNGIGTGMPDDSCEDHALDAARYWSMYELSDMNTRSYLQRMAGGPTVNSRVRNRGKKRLPRQQQNRNIMR